MSWERDKYFFSHVPSVLPYMSLYASVYMCLWSPAGKGLTSWLSFAVSNCAFVTFP